MESSEAVKYWFDLADYDYDTAKAMLLSKRYLYVGFMCHQTIEKALKALYANKNEQPPYTHNLTYLAKRIGIYPEMGNKEKILLDTLDPLNVEARYPTNKELLFKSLNYQRCEQLIKETGDLLLWIKQKLSAK